MCVKTNVSTRVYIARLADLQRHSALLRLPRSAGSITVKRSSVSARRISSKASFSLSFRAASEVSYPTASPLTSPGRIAFRDGRPLVDLRYPQGSRPYVLDQSDGAPRRGGYVREGEAQGWGAHQRRKATVKLAD